MSIYLHSVRPPVEIVLYGLFVNEMIPELMTFEGRNYDVFIGITAPIVGWLFLKQKINKTILISWNIIGLVFVLLFFVMEYYHLNYHFNSLVLNSPIEQ